MFSNLLNGIMKHSRAFLYVIALTTGLSVAFIHATRFEEACLDDIRTSLLHRSASRSTILVEVDDKSLQQVGPWPWRRSIHATLLNKLRDAHAKRVLFNVDFTSESPDLREDVIFSNALKRFGGKVVLQGLIEQYTSQSDALMSQKPVPNLANNSLLANSYWPIDSGVFRRANYSEVIDGKNAPSLASYIVDRGDLPTTGYFPIDWSIDPSTFDRISYSDVLRGIYDPSIFDGRIVIVGATANSLNDYVKAPHGYVVPGVLATLVAGETLRNGTPHPLGQFPMLGLSLIISACACFVRNSFVRIGIISAGVAMVVGGAFYLRWSSPIVVESVAALSVFFAVFIGQCGLWISKSILGDTGQGTHNAFPRSAL